MQVFTIIHRGRKSDVYYCELKSKQQTERTGNEETVCCLGNGVLSSLHDGGAFPPLCEAFPLSVRYHSLHYVQQFPSCVSLQ